MKIKDELNSLNTEDIYSLMLFVLYKSSNIPEYSSLSQLTYILDKDSLLKLCEFYGGLTIRIPTIQQLQELLEGLLMYQLIDIEGQNPEEVTNEFNKNTTETYIKIKEVLKNYSLNSGRNIDVV